MISKKIISHVRPTDMEVQTNEEHSNGVANLAYSFAEEFGMGAWGQVLGLFHDKGKERDSFQQYIKKVSGIDPNSGWHGEDKQHAFVGAVMAGKIYDRGVSTLLSYPLMGHHGGLDDFINHNLRLKMPVPAEISDINDNLLVELNF